MGVEMASMGCKGDLKRLESETASDVWREVTAPKRSLAVDRRAPGIAAAPVFWGASNPVPGEPTCPASAGPPWEFTAGDAPCIGCPT